MKYFKEHTTRFKLHISQGIKQIKQKTMFECYHMIISVFIFSKNCQHQDIETFIN